MLSGRGQWSAACVSASQSFQVCPFARRLEVEAEGRTWRRRRRKINGWLEAWHLQKHSTCRGTNLCLVKITGDISRRALVPEIFTFTLAASAFNPSEVKYVLFLKSSSI